MSAEDSIILDSVEATREYGELLARQCQPGDVMALHGVLGSGKTQLVKGLASGLGFEGEVTSPTFTIIHEYHGGELTIYHLDLYRFETQEEALRAGLEDYLPSDGVTVIEWPDRVDSILPPQTWHYTLEVASINERIIKRGRP